MDFVDGGWINLVWEEKERQTKEGLDVRTTGE